MHKFSRMKKKARAEQKATYISPVRRGGRFCSYSHFHSVHRNAEVWNFWQETPIPRTNWLFVPCMHTKHFKMGLLRWNEIENRYRESRLRVYNRVRLTATSLFTGFSIQICPFWTIHVHCAAYDWKWKELFRFAMRMIITNRIQLILFMTTRRPFVGVLNLDAILWCEMTHFSISFFCVTCQKWFY